MTTINPFEEMKKGKQETASIVVEALLPGAAQVVQPNKLESTNLCPVDGEKMKRMVAGQRGTDTEVPVNVCLKHRVCLPVANEDLGPEVGHL